MKMGAVDGFIDNIPSLILVEHSKIHVMSDITQGKSPDSGGGKVPG